MLALGCTDEITEDSTLTEGYNHSVYCSQFEDNFVCANGTIYINDTINWECVGYLSSKCQTDKVVVFNGTIDSLDDYIPLQTNTGGIDYTKPEADKSIYCTIQDSNIRGITLNYNAYGTELKYITVHNATCHERPCGFEGAYCLECEELS